MGKRIYLLRHCQASGQEISAPLTDEGKKQAFELVNFFKTRELDCIISSPFRRAIESVELLAKEKNMEIEIDQRLSERVLSAEPLIDWQEKLQASFDDLDTIFSGGESSRQAMERGKSVLKELQHGKRRHILIATHGNLMALIIKSFLPSFGYEDWKNLSNPDIYQIDFQHSEYTIKRIWK